MFETYTPQQLRDAIEIELQKCDDVKQASYNAIAQLKKNPAHYQNMRKARKVFLLPNGKKALAKQ